jgi:hypothetical protein
MSHILPRYTDTAIPHDPLEIALAQTEARNTAAREAIHNGTHTPDQAATLRGIPCITNGIPGTSPGTNPLQALIAKERHHAIRRT